MRGTLDGLQAKIDGSLRRASPLTRELFEADHMEAESVQRLINDAMSVSIATVGASGKPHASLTMIACSNGGDIYFGANRHSVLYRNLQRSSNIALTVDTQRHGMMAQGRAELVGNMPELPELGAALDALMERGRWLPRGWDGALYRVELDRIFAR